MSNTSLGLCIIYLSFYADLLFPILGCNLLNVGKTAKFGVRSSEVVGKLNLNLAISLCVMNIIIRL